MFFIIILLLSLQGRAMSRAKSRRNLDYTDVLEKMNQKGISIRVASPKLVMEEVSVRFIQLPLQEC